MDNETDKKPIQEKILQAIRSGRVKMRPKWRFVLHAALIVSGAILLLLALLYLVSFAVFSLRETGAWFVPAFGPRGWYAFLRAIPWFLIAVSLVFIAILETLVRRHSFAYRRPLLVSVCGIVLVVAIGSFIAGQAHFHGRFFRYAEGNRLPFAGRFYRAFGERHFRDVHAGTITALGGRGFVMEDRSGEALTVAITPRTRLPFGMDFSAGDAVVVFGERDDHTVQAFGIRRVADFEMRGPMHPRWRGMK